MTAKRLLYLTAVLAAMAAPLRMSAQSDAQFTQYYQVPTYYNAGAAGTTDLLRLRGGARLQWMGIDNAPKSFVVTADMPVKFLGKRLGVGVTAFQESLGLYKTLNIGAQLAYKLKLWGGELSIGVQPGFIDQSFKGSDVFIPDDDDYHESSDDAIPKRDLRGNAFDISAGVWYEHKKFWVGASCTHITSPTVTFNSGDNGSTTASTGENNYEFTSGRVAYLMAGSNISIKNTLFEVIPSVMLKTDFTFYTGEITARVRYNRFLSFGVGYRYNDALTAMIAAEIKNFYIGYSYDYPLTAIAKASTGSHELFVGYSLKLDFSDKNRHKHKAIRIM